MDFHVESPACCSRTIYWAAVAVTWTLESICLTSERKDQLNVTIMWIRPGPVECGKMIILRWLSRRQRLWRHQKARWRKRALQSLSEKRSLLETKSRFNKRSNGLQWILPDIQLWRRCPLGNRTLNRIMCYKNLSVCLFVCLYLCLSLSENWMHLPLPLPQWCPPPCTLSYALPLRIIASLVWGIC